MSTESASIYVYYASGRKSSSLNIITLNLHFQFLCCNKRIDLAALPSTVFFILIPNHSVTSQQQPLGRDLFYLKQGSVSND